MRRSRERGFALIVAVILGAILLIGVLGALHLGARRLDAERTEATRRLLPESFRAVFPYGVGQPATATAPNLFTDFGYRPDTPITLQRPGDATRSWDLVALVSRSQVGTSDNAFITPPPAFDGTNATSSWNGPYWRGSVDGSNRPLDAWGRFLQLRYVTSPSAGWVVHSAGANGRDDTTANAGVPGGDDLIYPAPPYVIPAAGSPVCANPEFTFFRSSYIPGEFLDITITWTANGGGSVTLTDIQFNNGSKYYGDPLPVFTNLPYGTLTITMVSSKRGTLPPVTLTMSASTCSGGSTVSF